MSEPQKDDSMLFDLIGPVTWPKIVLIALLLAFFVVMYVACG
jgi:hypothetical protein